MKIFKKVTSVVVAITMIATLFAVNQKTTEAAVKIVYGKKLSITVGGSDSIITSPKGATYKSSNKKIATVSKKGKVKGKKAGTCKITVSQKGSSKKVKVTVGLKKVTATSAALASDTSAKVSWKKVTGAAGYYVYYSNNRNSGFKKVTVKGGKKTSTVVSGLLLGQTYYFKIKAYAKAGKKTVASKSYSKILSAKTWKLVFSDEFNSSTLDSSKWSYQTGAGGYGNNELQNYTAGNNMEMKNGNLVIEPRFKWNATSKSAIANSYTSTKIWTKGKWSATYGKYEFRVKLPKGQGTWAAAWMLGNNNVWPLCGEIDVLETTSELTKTVIPQSIHNNKYNGMATSSGNKHYDSKITDATSAYHTYGIIWTATEITFTIDGRTTGVYDPNNFTFDGKGTSDANIWPFNQPFYLILNCAIGGTLGGTVTPTYWTKEATNGNVESYVDYYYIDWVRVSQ